MEHNTSPQNKLASARTTIPTNTHRAKIAGIDGNAIYPHLATANASTQASPDFFQEKTEKWNKNHLRSKFMNPYLIFIKIITIAQHTDRQMFTMLKGAHSFHSGRSGLPIET